MEDRKCRQEPEGQLPQNTLIDGFQEKWGALRSLTCTGSREPLPPTPCPRVRAGPGDSHLRVEGAFRASPPVTGAPTSPYPHKMRPGGHFI